MVRFINLAVLEFRAKVNVVIGCSKKLYSIEFSLIKVLTILTESAKMTNVGAENHNDNSLTLFTMLLVKYLQDICFVPYLYLA